MLSPEALFFGPHDRVFGEPHPAAQSHPRHGHRSLQHNGLAVEDVDHWFFHQANMRINEMVASHLKIPPDRSYHNIDRYGNLSAAAIPALPDEVTATR